MEGQIVERFPGISCAYVNAAGKEAAEYRGLADIETGAAVNADTLFPACSISKFVTALCLMILRERGAIDIDAPANDFLRQWKLLTADGRASDATIRSLMCHTAGIVDGEDAFYGLRRGDPEVRLIDILEGCTAYNSRPVRAEKPQGTAFEYSDAGYCVLQLLIQEVMNRPFEDVARQIAFEPLGLKRAFFASPENIARFEGDMATGYDDGGQPIPGRFPPVPDLAASGMWSTPTELIVIAKAFVAALNGASGLLREDSAREMARPVDRFPWTGLGVFIGGADTLVSQGWGEHGQCMLKMNGRTGAMAVVMTNRNPGVDQAASGIERLVDQKMA